MNPRHFQKLIFARGVSTLGDAIFLVGIPLIVFQKTGSAEKLGFSMAVEMSVLMIFAMVGGYLTDRLNPRGIVFWGDLSRLLLIATYALVFFNSPWFFPATLVLLLLLSAIGAVYNVAFDTLPLKVLEGENLNKALALNQNLVQGSSIFGTLAAGYLLAFGGGAAILWANALSFAVPLLALRFLPAAQVDPASHPSGESSFWATVFGGFRIVATDPWLRPVTLLAVILNLVLGVHDVAWIPYLKSTLQTTDVRVTQLQVVATLSYIAATALARPYLQRGGAQKWRALMTSQIFLVVFSLGFAVQPTVLAAALLVAGLSVATALHGLPSTLLRKEIVAPEAYGRVLAAARVLSRIAAPLSMTVAAVLLKRHSPQALHVYAGALGLLLSIPCFYSLLPKLAGKYERNP